jgi:CheY-like chemotaxis protein
LTLPIRGLAARRGSTVPSKPNPLGTDPRAEAVALFAQEGPAVAAVLMDLVMPVMDGWATMQALASLNPLVKVIAMSGHTPSGTAPGSLPNLKAVLTKPFTTAELVHTLIGVLQAEPAPAGPRAVAPGRTPSV